MVAVLGYFNPRTHTGCDCKMKSSSNVAIKFQSTHPHGVRLSKSKDVVQWVTPFQSTHPHGVRQTKGWYLVDVKRISIHAPTRGATGNFLNFFSYAFLFQSTHPHGVRLSIFFAAKLLGHISIHAPTRGATTMNVVNI